MHLYLVPPRICPPQYKEIIKKIAKINHAGISIAGGMDNNISIDTANTLDIEIPEIKGYYTALWYNKQQKCIEFQVFRQL